MKKLFYKIHQYLGLTTGIVVFIVSVTGCMWAFKEEIQSLYLPDTSVEIKDEKVITATEAKEIALTVFPDKRVHGTLYSKPGEAVEVIFYQEEPVEFYSSVFLNPYDGNVITTINHETGFFHFILHGHMYLWLPEKIGENVVSISVLLFMIILISGLILWWPKKKNSKDRFKFRWKETTRWRRKNFDLHAITGFYIMFLALILAFTGSVMAFDWFHTITYRTLGGDKEPFFMIPDGNSFSQTQIDSSDKPIDKLIPMLQKEYPDADSFEIHYPYSDSSSIYVEVSSTSGVYYNSDYLFFDQYTLQAVSTPSIYGEYTDAGISEKLIRMNYDIHVGAIGGLPGKIIAFLASLFTATLPITGFLMWYGRKKKTNESLNKSFHKNLIVQPNNK